MPHSPTFAERAFTNRRRLRPAEAEVARFFQNNREEVLVTSASALASKIGTSDATVIRATKALGYPSLAALRRQLAAELRLNLSPASRLVRTLDEMAGKPISAFDMTLDIHIKAIEELRRDISQSVFQDAIDLFTAAQRVFIFGIGPSSALADYCAIQLGRFGIESATLSQTGLLLADGLHRVRKGDLVVILAYSRVYQELEALLKQVDRLGLATVLLTDTLGDVLYKRVNLVLPVARGRADQLSMHTATLGLIEALLVGVAAKRPAETIRNLELLNDLRAGVVGEPMDLPVPRSKKSIAVKRRGNGSRRLSN